MNPNISKRLLDVITIEFIAKGLEMNSSNTVLIEIATDEDAAAITGLVGKLLHEIMASTGAQHFSFDAQTTELRCKEFIEENHYTVFKSHLSSQLIGILTLTASGSLYAGGKFGVIQELYVEKDYRSQGVGELLVNAAKQYGKEQGWVRLEVATPPLPAFDRTLSFYERQQFTVTGGRKMKVTL